MREEGVSKWEGPWTSKIIFLLRGNNPSPRKMGLKFKVFRGVGGLKTSCLSSNKRFKTCHLKKIGPNWWCPVLGRDRKLFFFYT